MLSSAFKRLAWSNVAAQSAEQIGLGLVAAAAGFLIQAVVILVSPVRRLARQSEMGG